MANMNWKDCSCCEHVQKHMAEVANGRVIKKARLYCTIYDEEINIETCPNGLTKKN